MVNAAPRDLAGIDGATAQRIARLLSYPEPFVRRSRGAGWRRLALAEFAILVGVLSVLLGIQVREHLLAAPAARTAATARVTPPHTALPAASPLPQSGATASPAPYLALARSAMESAASCQGCLGTVAASAGDAAAYVTAPAGGSTCFAVVHDAGSQWAMDASGCRPGATSPLAPGAVAIVGAPGTCARLHATAGLASPVVVCVPDRGRVTIASPPAYADGHVWFTVDYGSLRGVVALDALSY